MTGITSARPFTLVFILLLGACSQTARQTITESDIASTPTQSTEQISQSAATPEFWKKIPALKQFHNYANGLSWKLTDKGINAKNHRVNETADSARVERVWNNYGALILQASNKYGVPVELILTTICVESAGVPTAKGGNNYGLMQTTLATAKTSLGNDQLVVEDLYNPVIAIEAGTSYIKMQYVGGGWFGNSTHYDLPKVVAAYNAGRLSQSAASPWGMKIYTRNHIDKSVVYFNESLAFLSRQDTIPRTSFAAYFANQ